jgi:hypothetical protein
MTEEQKTEEHKHEEHHAEHKSEGIKLNLTNWGKNTKEVLENVSFFIIVISAIAVSVGIGIGSFIQGTVLIAVTGSFFVMAGIVIYIISQFIEVNNG